MIIENLPLNGAKVFYFKSNIDNRGSFRRLLCRKEMEAVGLKKEIVQVNHSITNIKGTVRGMHFQYPPYAETKIIRCICGSVLDVIIDIRRNAPTFLQWCSILLSLDNDKGIYIPEGFAHGFQALTDNAQLMYFHTEYYNPAFEGALNFMDPLLNIKFPLKVTEISEKDRTHPFIDTNFIGLNL